MTGPKIRTDAAAILYRQLTALRQAYTETRLALCDLGQPPPEPDVLDALLRASPRLARELRDELLGKILARPTWERNLLLDVLEAWVAAGGSPERAARKLNIHKNTVRNRLYRCSRLTGVQYFQRWGNYDDLAHVSLALRAHRILDGVR